MGTTIIFVHQVYASSAWSHSHDRTPRWRLEKNPDIFFFRRSRQENPSRAKPQTVGLKPPISCGKTSRKRGVKLSTVFSCFLVRKKLKTTNFWVLGTPKMDGLDKLPKICELLTCCTIWMQAEWYLNYKCRPEKTFSGVFVGKRRGILLRMGRSWAPKRTGNSAFHPAQVATGPHRNFWFSTFTSRSVDGFRPARPQHLSISTNPLQRSPWKHGSNLFEIMCVSCL